MKLDKDIRLKSFDFLKKNSLPNKKQALHISIEPKIVVDSNFMKKDFSGFKHEILGNGFESFFSKEYYAEDISKFKESKDWFFHLNRLKSSSVLFLRITKNMQEPIILNLDFSNSDSCGSVYILLEKNATADLIINKNCDSKKQIYVGCNLNVFASDGSKINIFSRQNYSSGVNAFEKNILCGFKNASINFSQILSSGSFVKADTESHLEDMGAKTEMISCYSSKDEQRIDLISNAFHNSKNTKSNTITRGLVSQESKALSQGTIFMNKDSSGSSGFEKQDAIILGENAQADAIPNLEILNSDVECTHSSSIGQIDSQKIFYLTSRGVSENEAKNLIARGYFSGFSEKVSNDLRLEFEEEISLAINKIFP